MNGGLDKVSYIIKRQDITKLRLSYKYCALSAGYEKFVVNQHKYITYRSKGEDLN